MIQSRRLLSTSHNVKLVKVLLPPDFFLTIAKLKA